MALSIPTITLNDGRAMPLLGLGTYKSTEKEAEKAIVTAAKYGYRLIDTASSYKNEDSIGRGIRASGICLLYTSFKVFNCHFYDGFCILTCCFCVETNVFCIRHLRNRAGGRCV